MRLEVAVLRVPVPCHGACIAFTLTDQRLGSSGPIA
jgi:hypothetical protein